jgi:hypothetical protein
VGATGEVDALIPERRYFAKLNIDVDENEYAARSRPESREQVRARP